MVNQRHFLQLLIERKRLTKAAQEHLNKMCFAFKAIRNKSNCNKASREGFLSYLATVRTMDEYRLTDRPSELVNIMQKGLKWTFSINKTAIKERTKRNIESVQEAVAATA